MDLFQNLIRTDENSFLFSMDTDIDNIILVQNYGYKTNQGITEQGYAHLLEHMTIHSNNLYLNDLEKGGVVFNAETQPYQTCYMFLDLDGKAINKHLVQGRLNLIFNSKFTEEDLSIERSTIIEEHAILANTMSKRDADLMLGNIEQIKAFDLNALIDIRENQYAHPLIITMGNKRGIGIKSLHMVDIDNFADEKWYEKVDVIRVVQGGNYIGIEFSENKYSELFVYSLKVFFCALVNSKLVMNIERQRKKIKVEFYGDVEQIRATTKIAVDYKKHAYQRYYINLSSYKYLQAELIYVTSFLSSKIDTMHLDFEKIFLATPWEDTLYEKYFKSEN